MGVTFRRFTYDVIFLRVMLSGVARSKRHGIGAGGGILYEHPASAVRAGLQTTWYRCWCSSQRSRKRRLAGVCPADVADTLPEWLAIGVQHGYATNNELAKRTHHSHRRAIRPVARFKGKRDGEVVVLGDERTDNALVCVRKEGEGVAGHAVQHTAGHQRQLGASDGCIKGWVGASKGLP